VALQSVDAEDGDSVVTRFLGSLAMEIERRPDVVVALSRDFAGRLRTLTKGVPVDVDAAIEGPIDL
jgi:hypothetical protein